MLDFSNELLHALIFATTCMQILTQGEVWSCNKEDRVYLSSSEHGGSFRYTWALSGNIKLPLWSQSQYSNRQKLPRFFKNQKKTIIKKQLTPRAMQVRSTEKIQVQKSKAGVILSFIIISNFPEETTANNEFVLLTGMISRERLNALLGHSCPVCLPWRPTPTLLLIASDPDILS